MKKIILYFIAIASLLSLSTFISLPIMAANNNTGKAVWTCSIPGVDVSGVENLAGCQTKCTSTSAPGGVGTTPLQGICSSSIVVSPAYINHLIETYTQWFMVIVSSIAVIMIIWAGLKFIMAKGDPKNTESARKMILYALIGLAIVLLAGGAIWTITNFLNVGGTGGSV